MIPGLKTGAIQKAVAEAAMLVANVRSQTHLFQQINKCPY